MLYCHDPIKPLQCPWPWNINWHQCFQEWMKKWISEETQKCIEHNQTIIIRMIIVERNVRWSNVAILATIYQGTLCDLDLFFTVFGDKTSFPFAPSGEEFWYDLIKCPGRGPPSYQWEAWSWWPSITPWQLANKYYQQENGAGPGRGHGGQTIDQRAMCHLASLLWTVCNRDSNEGPCQDS